MGQITIDSWFGNFLYETCKTNSDIRNVVEIGTWDGMGSTKCIIDGLIDSNKNKMCFVSLEANQNMYSIACQAWSEKLPPWASLIHGRIIEKSDMDFLNLSDEEKEWFQIDIDAINTCPNIFDSLPPQIDLLLLDGGEFSTKAEFNRLVSRSNMIVLDDTNSRKCKWIREQVYACPDKYRLIFDLPNIRAGIMAFLTIRNSSS